MEQQAFFSDWTKATPTHFVIEGPLAFRLAGFKPLSRQETLVAAPISGDWAEQWFNIAEALRSLAPDGVGYRAAVVENATLEEEAILARLRPLREMHLAAANAWLIDDLKQNRLDCYFQRVVDRRNQVIGYEALARMESADGGVLGAGAILKAARALNMEYEIDQRLQRCAIGHYCSQGFRGALFVNFLTNFSQQPEVYLQGLGQAVAEHGLAPGQVVLDLAVGQYGREIASMQAIALYCRAQGFQLALDDVTTLPSLKRLLEHLKPSYVKIDRTFGEELNPAKRQAALAEAIALSQAHGARVLAEGVETTQAHQAYSAAGVDLFQGYLYGFPTRYPEPSLQAQA